MTEKLSIRNELRADFDAVHALHFRAFGDNTVPDMVRDLRACGGAFAPVSLVAVADDGAVVGHVMLTHAWLDGPKRLFEVQVLSPLGVLPDRQRQGVGKALIKAALHRAETMGSPLVFLEGDPRYYRARGFEKAGDVGFRRPSLRIPEGAFQVARLSTYDKAMTGTFVYRDVHWRHGVGLYRDE